MKPVTVVHEPTLKVLERFDTISEAETYTAEVVSASNPKGVEAGEYGIDAPEDML